MSVLCGDEQPLVFDTVWKLSAEHHPNGRHRCIRPLPRHTGERTYIHAGHPGNHRCGCGVEWIMHVHNEEWIGDWPNLASTDEVVMTHDLGDLLAGRIPYQLTPQALDVLRDANPLMNPLATSTTQCRCQHCQHRVTVTDGDNTPVTFSGQTTITDSHRGEGSTRNVTTGATASTPASSLSVTDYPGGVSPFVQVRALVEGASIAVQRLVGWEGAALEASDRSIVTEGRVSGMTVGDARVVAKGDVRGVVTHAWALARAVRDAHSASVDAARLVAVLAGLAALVAEDEDDPGEPEPEPGPVVSRRGFTIDQLEEDVAGAYERIRGLSETVTQLRREVFLLRGGRG